MRSKTIVTNSYSNTFSPYFSTLTKCDRYVFSYYLTLFLNRKILLTQNILNAQDEEFLPARIWVRLKLRWRPFSIFLRSATGKTIESRTLLRKSRNYPLLLECFYTLLNYMHNVHMDSWSWTFENESLNSYSLRIIAKHHINIKHNRTKVKLFFRNSLIRI